jgi:beta-glucosidase
MLDPAFVFGVATSSFQIEGDAAERLPSIWDEFCGQPGRIRDGSDGRVACDHVRRWRDDVDLVSWLGVDAYRFSIAWPRVVDRDGRLNRKGLDFYRQLVDALNERGIRPFATLYHWDLPQHLQDAGGWLNRDTALRFRDYVALVSDALDGVYSYATLNEPWCSAYLGHETGAHAPGLSGHGMKAAHHLLLAHGLGMQVLAQTRPDSLNGIVLNFSPCYPATGSAADAAAAALADEKFNRWYLEPLVEGRYPPLLERTPAARRPDIRDGDMELIAQPLDFLGVNYYTRAVYRDDGQGGFEEVAPAPPLTAMGWQVWPRGLTDLLVNLDRRYDLPPVYVAENGAAISDSLVDGQVDDLERVDYLARHLDAVVAAMEQGVNIGGFFYWSLLDNFEWTEGYTKRFGLVYVDYDSQERIVKRSAHCYRDFLARRRYRLREAPAGTPMQGST